MKIGQPAEKPAAPATTGTTGAPTAAVDTSKHAHGSAAADKADKADKADASAKVELSSTAASLLAGGTSSEFDADKVARMSQAIASGSYQVNPDVIADKLIGNAQELLTKVKG